MSPGNLLLLALTAAAVAVFVFRLLLFVKLLKLAPAGLSFKDGGPKLKRLLLEGFAQRLVLREPAGLGHFFIFWGFLSLIFGTSEGYLSRFIPGFSYAFLGPLYPAINTVQDLFSALVIIALAAALFRHVILRPRRLEGPLRVRIDALLVISAVFLIVFSFLAARSIHPKPGFAPVSAFLFGLQGGSWGDTAFQGFEWLHNGLVLGFVAYIPFSKHTHILAALPNLFFTEPRIRGRIAPLKLDGENTESFGIAKITDYPQKDLLDLPACTACGRCQEACPAYSTGKPLSPKFVIQDLKKHLFDNAKCLLKPGGKEACTPLYQGVITSDVLWACTTCYACQEVCPVEIMPMDKLVGIRQNRVLMEGDFPEAAQTALRNIETQSNPWGFAQADRAKWAAGSGIKTLAENPDVEYLLFVGCAGSYDERAIQVTRALVKILRAADVQFGILGAEEHCTGDSAKRIGNEYLAQQLFQKNIEAFERYKVKKILTLCPHCFNTLRNEYPDFNGRYEVVHHTRFIRDLIDAGRLRLKPDPDAPKIVYHDSCYLGRYNGLYDEPRAALKAATGHAPLEMGNRREKSFCCGAGGGRMWMEETLGTRINETRTREALKTGAGEIATACPFCLNMMADGIKSAGAAGVAARDIAEIVARAIA